jgi:hypothetical protein
MLLETVDVGVANFDQLFSGAPPAPGQLRPRYLIIDEDSALDRLNKLIIA